MGTGWRISGMEENCSTSMAPHAMPYLTAIKIGVALVHRIAAARAHP
jgi:hypothetical protein